ncbi:MAG: PilZ domain-containing protein [Ruminococcus sp.]|jgi:hypothetical protein|nr:PilZ domain-containing protein [Ruminococcus sp.]
MINKDKIRLVTIYDTGNHLILTAKAEKISFPRDFFRLKGSDLVVVKGKDFPLAFKGTQIYAIFEYLTGDRVKYNTAVELGSDTQWNFRVADGQMLEERRRFYKVNVDFDGTADYYIHNDEIFTPPEPFPLHFMDLNLGGAFFSCEACDFELGDTLQIRFMNGEMILMTEILRVQKDEHTGKIKGYGTKFTSVSLNQEEQMSRFIFECQLAEREKRRELENKGYI